MRANDENLPVELQEVAERLRKERPEASALDLDRIKTRAMATAATSRPKGFALKSRGIAAFLTLALMAAGTGGVIAGGGNGNGNGSASNSQYKPGCGPKKTDGVNPSGTHTGPPGQGDTNRESCPQ
ncbi:MAG: hypothetical protein QOJ14_361 [Thermoleophilaceae bacterium]|jgi:hypothetical protein|nr:hypothetical protein [Thermoleophilaceae bacterium]